MNEDEKHLKEEVKRSLEQAEATDAEEDPRYARDRTGDELPAELGRRETRLCRKCALARFEGHRTLRMISENRRVDRV
jgi:hypothetical protein